MVELALVELVGEEVDNDEAEGQESHEDEGYNQQQEEVPGHSRVFPLYQVLRLLEEVTPIVHVVESEGCALLEILELAKNVLLFNIVFLFDLGVSMIFFSQSPQRIVLTDLGVSNDLVVPHDQGVHQVLSEEEIGQVGSYVHCPEVRIRSDQDHCEEGYVGQQVIWVEQVG